MAFWYPCRPLWETGMRTCMDAKHNSKFWLFPQCNTVPRMTVRDFTDQICLRARDVDPDLIGTGLQRIDTEGKRLFNCQLEQYIEWWEAPFGVVDLIWWFYRSLNLRQNFFTKSTIGWWWFIHWIKHIPDVSSACAVWCDTRGGGYKSRGWSLPDGTACSRMSPMFCINGVCQVRNLIRNS